MFSTRICKITLMPFQVVSALLGAGMGLLHLNLGVISNFHDLLQNFHQGPEQWWNACISKKGTRHIPQYARDQLLMALAYGSWHCAPTLLSARHSPLFALQLNLCIKLNNERYMCFFP